MRFEAVKAMKALETLAKMEMAAVCGNDAIPSQTLYEALSVKCEGLVPILQNLGMNREAQMASDIVEFMRNHHKSAGISSISHLLLLVHHDLEGYAFEAVPSDRVDYYNCPLNGWEKVIERFECAFDIEEAGKCFALGRYTASVFHLMKITERGVLDLQCFLDTSDPKAHFGSVLQKLETLQRKTNFNDLPPHQKAHRDFLIGILAQLHAVKDAWRNKVTHADEKIIPTDEFAEEMARGVYQATSLLMKKLAEGLPPKSQRCVK